MKRILLSVLFFACAIGAAQAQFSPNTVLTATALNNALAAPAITGGSINGSTTILTTGAVTLNGINTFGSNTSATTQAYLDNSNFVATTQFVKRSLLAATATIPMTITGGTYNFASAGSGAIFGVTTSGGAIASITSIVAGGTGYQVGDVLTMVGGNGDGLVYVNSVSSGVVQTASVFYGGTGYSGTPQLSGLALPPGSRTGALTGTLTSNALIIIPGGSYLSGARRIGFQNNTIGNFTVTAKLTNGSGGSTGTGVVLPQGSANSTSMILYTDGVSDVWNETAGTRPLYTAAGVVLANGHSTQGTVTLSGGTAAVTFVGGAAFTSAASYVCNVSDTTAAANVSVVQNSGSSITLNGTGVHVLNYRCTGN